MSGRRSGTSAGSADRGIVGDHYRPSVDRFEPVRFHDVPWRSARGNLSFVEKHDGVGEARDEIQLVAHEEHSQAGPCER